MGICLSNQIKAQSPLHNGFISCENVSGNETELSNSSSKDPSASIPSTPSIEGEILQSSNLKSFAFRDLKAATRNFRPDRVLGVGRFGSVYKGWVDEHSLAASKPGTGMVIAVKRLNQEGWQGHKEWLAEVNYLGQLRHPNLVKLIGYCLENDHRLLVYEFMPKGSMENHLFRRGSYFQPLSWSLRMKIALCAARGLAFLHNADIKVIYQDFRTSSILLDSNYNAKLSDLRLARDVPTGDKSNVPTRVFVSIQVMGPNNGYMAPEYPCTGYLTTKSDVYSFGVVVLEIISGKKAMDNNFPMGERNLVKWAKPFLMNKRRMLSILDPRLEGQYSTGQALKVATLVLQCLCENPKLRPKMNEVVTALEQVQDSKDTSTYDQNRHKSNHNS